MNLDFAVFRLKVTQLLGSFLPISPGAVCQGLCTVLDEEEAFGIVSLKTSWLRKELPKVVCKKCCGGRYKQSPREEHVLSTSSSAGRSYA